MSLLWLSAMIPRATPCHEDACAPHTLPQLALLYASLILISLSAGAVRSSTAAFGADQLTTIPSYGQIANNYGQIANNLPSPTRVSYLLRSLNITRIKLYDAEPNVLRAFFMGNENENAPVHV